MMDETWKNHDQNGLFYVFGSLVLREKGREWVWLFLIKCKWYKMNEVAKLVCYTLVDIM